MDNLQELWKKWRLEVLVLGSLILQVILLSFGSLRKRSSWKPFISLIWVTYLSADWVATFALGTISSTLSCSSPSYAKIDIIALWAPFLLLHLGGPDTITAFSLEDNQLWLRHAMTLLLQTIAAVHIFIISMPQAKLISPAAFIFIAGILKYGERIWALKKGSLKGLRGLSTTRIEDFYRPILKVVWGRNNHWELFYQAYYSFRNFRKLFLDQILSSDEAGLFRPKFNRSIDPCEAFQMMEIALSFVYDTLYTKALVVHSQSGRFLRAACLCSEFAAFFLFLGTEKKDYHKVDVAITYSLLTAALALEIVALGLLIFSDWTIVAFAENLLDFNESGCLMISFCELVRVCQKDRWSNRIGQYSLLCYCVKNHRAIAWFDELLTSFGMKEMWNEVRYTEFVQIQDGLKKFIFNHLKDLKADLKKEKKDEADLKKGKKDEADFILTHLRSQMDEPNSTSEPNSTRTLSEQRQDFSRNRGGRALVKRQCFQLSWSTERAFDESILLWNIAIDICLIRLDDTSTGRSEGTSNDEEHHREWAKNLSRYLLYLLLVRPLAMSSTSGLTEIRYQHTCVMAMEFFKCLESLVRSESEAVEILMSRGSSFFNDDGSHSVLGNAVKLAEQLLELREREMWTIVCEVLVEMLFFAARHCKGNYHAQMLSYGGELVTFVWFLEAHHGLLEYYDDDLITPEESERTESSAQSNESLPELIEV